MGFISLDEKVGEGEGDIEAYTKFDKYSSLQFNLGAEYAFLNFDSSALYAKFAVGVWGQGKLKTDWNVEIDPEVEAEMASDEYGAIMLEELREGPDLDDKVKVKQPNLYFGLGWFFSNVNGSFMKDFGSKIELGYQMQKLEAGEEDFRFSNIRIKGALTYSIR